jgi:hypothetical protein
VTDNNRDAELFFLAALAAQQIARHEYESKINALVAAGHPMNQARTIVDAWYIVYRPREWYPAVWQLLSIGAVVLTAVNLVNLEPGGVLTCLGLAALLSWRARYCQEANTRAYHAGVQATRVLKEHGQL